MSLAIVTAFGAEYQAVWSALSSPEALVKKDESGYAVTKGLLFEIPVLLMITGMGKAAIDQHFAMFVSRFSPSHALCLGFCGGLSFSAKVGTVSIPDAIVDLNGKSLSPSLSLRQKVAKKFYDEDRDFLVGNMVTVDKIIETAEERKRINAATGAVAVDMESFYFAKDCETKKLPWFVMKTVMDDLETKSFNRDDLKPGLESAKKELLNVLPSLMSEVQAEWKL